MKTVKCDKCNCENARSYKYFTKMTEENQIDLCIGCLQEFVIQTKYKLSEMTNTNINQPSKQIIHG